MPFFLFGSKIFVKILKICYISNWVKEKGEGQMKKLKALKICLVLNVLLGSNAYLASPVLADDETSSQQNGGGH